MCTPTLSNSIHHRKINSLVINVSCTCVSVCVSVSLSLSSLLTCMCGSPLVWVCVHSVCVCVCVVCVCVCVCAHVHVCVHWFCTHVIGHACTTCTASTLSEISTSGLLILLAQHLCHADRHDRHNYDLTKQHLPMGGKAKQTTRDKGQSTARPGELPVDQTKNDLDCLMIHHRQRSLDRQLASFHLSVIDSFTLTQCYIHTYLHLWVSTLLHA